ncbi:Crp/Fnr family transcriptional regulator [Sulfurimonas sp. SAG-AH-194-I05]|nr:Crp/Fnr family transcriptional regulator [Sulfurimonas sp. SAG-AH-194-I05]MDF1875788.1 Crp/Fnr family transcriptional regulator [Sulfurimonas sp. SAG-AH-194-I05]
MQLSKICSISKYKKGSSLFLQGDTSDSLLLITEGLVSVFKHDTKGNEIIIGIFKPYELIAEAAILKHIPFPSSAMFKTDGSLIKIKIDTFEKDFLSNPKVSYAVIQSLLGKIQLLQQNIHFNIASNAKEKILHFYKKNQTLGIELKKYEISALLGMTAETFSRNVKKLLNDEKLKKVQNYYEINTTC